ncbi:MAG: hypothetical protein LBJ87_02660 [bacterium]|nr:hypothetical protein [bacterium]
MTKVAQNTGHAAPRLLNAAAPRYTTADAASTFDTSAPLSRSTAMNAAKPRPTRIGQRSSANRKGEFGWAVSVVVFMPASLGGPPETEGVSRPV